jgi:hypothetical protein
MMPNYRIDREWSDQFIPRIKTLVGPLLLQPSSLQIDRTEAADLIILVAKDLRIAARVRRAGYAAQYPWQFTVRSFRESGEKTELSKIIDGWGDWFFYGHHWAGREPDRNGPEIRPWWLIDLHAFRAALIRDRKELLIKTGTMENGDGTSFRWFDIRSFPKNILIETSHKNEWIELWSSRASTA